MRLHRILPLLAAVVPLAAAAQSSDLRPEVRPFVGAFVPTGAQHDDFKAASLVGMQAALELAPWAHVVGTVSWTHGHARFSSLESDVTHIWQYDIGPEFNLQREFENGWLLKPFAGLGIGARTYDYRAPGLATNACTAGYGALGTELQWDYVAFRVEGRDYLSCFEHPRTGVKQTRNDLGISFGLALHLDHWR